MASCVTVRLAPERRREFDLLHSAANDAGWCRCVAWWHPTWEGFGESTADENRSVREELCARGEYDGYLLLDGAEAIAWLQAGPRDEQDRHTSRYPIPQCVQRHALTGVASVATEDATAMTYLGGFSIKYGPGRFDGSAKSGYRSAVKVRFGTPAPGSYWYWCGHDYYPLQSSKVRAGR